jgi:hypothetical protein
MLRLRYSSCLGAVSKPESRIKRIRVYIDMRKIIVASRDRERGMIT